MTPERQKELIEVNALIGALLKKYNVTLGVSLNDLNEEPKNSETSEAKAPEAASPEESK